MILNISINTEDFSEVGQVQMPPTETADSLVDNWDECVAQAKRINGEEWSVNDVIDLMAGRGFKITIDHESVPLFY